MNSNKNPATDTKNTMRFIVYDMVMNYIIYVKQDMKHHTQYNGYYLLMEFEE